MCSVYALDGTMPDRYWPGILLCVYAVAKCHSPSRSPDQEVMRPSTRGTAFDSLSLRVLPYTVATVRRVMSLVTTVRHRPLSLRVLWALNVVYCIVFPFRVCRSLLAT